MTGRAESSRWVWVASAAFLAILVAATLVALLWPRIELAYHRHYFRKGTPEQQGEAYEWICVHWLREGMTRQQVESILGERLERRFERLGPEDMLYEVMYLFYGGDRSGASGGLGGSPHAYVLDFRPGRGLKQFVCYAANDTYILAPGSWSAGE